MKKTILLAFLFLNFSCSDKLNYDAYRPKFNLPKKIDFNSIIHIKLDTLKTNKITQLALSNRKDSIIISYNLDFKKFYKKDLKKGQYIHSIIYSYKGKALALKWVSHQYGLFDSNRKLLYESGTHKLVSFYGAVNEEDYLKSKHGILSNTVFKIEYSSISLDSIGEITLFQKIF